MLNPKHRFLVSMCLLIGAAISSIASSEEAENSLKGGAELGYVATDGNSNTKTINAKLDITKSWNAWSDNVKLDAINSKQDSERSAEKYTAFNKLNYNFNDHDYAFWGMDYQKDRFSGFEYQAGTSFGYGRKLLHTDKHYWDFEAGPGYRVSEVESGDKQEEAVIKLATHYDWTISETAKFSQLLSHEEGKDNGITLSETGLTTRIVGKLAMKFSYKVKYQEEVPVGFEHTDTETAMTLVYLFE